MSQGKKFNPNIHHRKAMRLRGYDYSQNGMYFVTICTRNKLCIFGKIEVELMVFSGVGLVALNCWEKIPEHFPNVVLHDYVIMPNHIHGIIEIKNEDDRNISTLTAAPDFNRFQHMVPRSVSSIVKGFKIGVTKQIRQQTVEGLGFTSDFDREGTSQPSIWQSRFHDHIIRNEEEYFRISNYIIITQKIGFGTNFIH